VGIYVSSWVKLGSAYKAGGGSSVRGGELGGNITGSQIEEREEKDKALYSVFWENQGGCPHKKRSVLGKKSEMGTFRGAKGREG